MLVASSYGLILVSVSARLSDKAPKSQVELKPPLEIAWEQRLSNHYHRTYGSFSKIQFLGPYMRDPILLVPYWAPLIFLKLPYELPATVNMADTRSNLRMDTDSSGPCCSPHWGTFL